MRSYFNTFFNEKVELVAEGGMGNPTLENGETEYPFEVTLPSEKDGAETSFNYCFGSFNLTGNEHGNMTQHQYELYFSNLRIMFRRFVLKSN